MTCFSGYHSFKYMVFIFLIHVPLIAVEHLLGYHHLGSSTYVLGFNVLDKVIRVVGYMFHSPVLHHYQLDSL